MFSGAEFVKANQIFKQAGPDSDPVDLAWAVFVSANMGFGGTIGHGWAYCFKRNQTSAFFNKKNLLYEAKQRLDGVYIECDDALNLIKKWDRPGVLFYLDPPYPNTEMGHYAGYTQADFQALIDLIQVSKGSFVLSCYPNEAVPSDWQRYDFIKNCDIKRAKTRKKVTECVWVVDRSDALTGGHRQMSIFQSVAI